MKYNKLGQPGPEGEINPNYSDLYFEKLQQMPWWMISLWVSVVAAIYGIKATELTKFKK